jgi:hypothetical protein
MLPDRSREYWDFFISECVRQKAPLYFRLAKGVRDAEALSALAAKVRASQPMANLLFGAVHYLFLCGGHPFLERALSHSDGRFGPSVRRSLPQFCLAHEAEIALQGA